MNEYVIGTLILKIEEDRKRLGLSKDVWALFITDGHTSRYSAVMLETLRQHKILLYLLPSHTSQCTQPLDLVTFGAMKTSLMKNLKELFRKKRPENIPSAAYNRCIAIKAALEAFHVASSKDKIKSAFKRGGLVISNGQLIVDPSKIAQHLANPEHVFETAIEPPPRTAVYSCVLNTPELIQEIEIAKSSSSTALESKYAWARIADLRDDLTEAEMDHYTEHPDQLPWQGNPVIGKDDNLAFEPGKGKRVSIVPHTEDHWSKRLLEKKKYEIARQDSWYHHIFFTV